MTARPGGAERFYRGILCLYPAEFRHRFGEDMVQLFHDRLRDARSSRAPGGAVVAWMALLVDVVVTASLEHRRRQTMAHSLTSAPSLTSRTLGFAGIAAGLFFLAAFVIELPADLFPVRVVAFVLGVVAIGIGLHRRQSSRAPLTSLVVTVAVVAATAFFLVTAFLFEPGHLATFWSQVTLWLASAAFGAASAWIGAVSRIGGWAVAIGSLLTLTGIDRLGLISMASPTIFNTLSQVGIVCMALGWIILGLDVALRRSTAQVAG